MSRATAPPASGRVLPPVAVAVLESLYRHRLLTVSQLQALHAPHASSRWVRLILTQLCSQQLAERVRGPHNAGLWFATQQGAEAVEAAGRPTQPRRRLTTPAQAAGPLRAHTLALNDACIAFVVAARQRGDECGPLSWQHERAHRLAARAPRGPAGMVIADALISYLQTDPDGSLILHQRFIELDRASTPAVELAGKLARYQQLRNQPASTNAAPAPDWRERYPAFPEVLVVIAGVSATAARKRVQHVIALHRAQTERHGTGRVSVRFTVLQTLIARGPFAPIFITAADPGRHVDWLGNPQPQQQER